MTWNNADENFIRVNPRVRCHPRSISVQHGRGQRFQTVEVVQVEPLEHDTLDADLGPRAKLLANLPARSHNHTALVELSLIHI